MFLHKYALAIGWPVPLLSKLMTSHDIAEAMAYERLDPFGNERADFRAGIVASTIANAHRTKKDKPFSPHDFMPKFGREKEDSRKTLTKKILEAFNIGDLSNPRN